MTAPGPRSLRLLALPVLICLALPGSAAADKVTAKTNFKNSCVLTSFAVAGEPTLSGRDIAYGAEVRNCEARYEIRWVSAAGALFRNTWEAVDTLSRERSDLPYENATIYEDAQVTDPYRARLWVTVVLKTPKKKRSKAGKVERWRDPGRRCHVGSGEYARDTLGCQLIDKLPPAG